jgi:lysozyme
MNMLYSKDGLHLTESSEGVRLKAYQDSGGVWTIGYGHTRGVQAGDTCTQEQAEAWLEEDLMVAVEAVNRLVKVPLSQHQFDALVDFTFNAGQGSFASSTMLRLINSGELVAADAQFARWDMAGGAHVAGLAVRRLAEAREFDEPDVSA